MSDHEPGLLHHANRWSWFGLIAAPSLGISLFIANLAYYAGDPKGDLILRPLHSQIAVALGTLGVASVVVQVGVRLIRNQRRLIRLLEGQARHDPDPAREMSPDQINGLTPEMVDVARRVSARLNHAA